MAAMGKTGGTVGTNGSVVRGVSRASRQSTAVLDRLAADDLMRDEEEPLCVMRSDGARVWTLHGRPHNDNGPAIVSADGGRWWYRHGVRHREDGPAVEYADGGVEWWVDGEPHNPNGPAVEYADGTCEWYLHGQRIPEMYSSR